jgi:hypothetical protein
MSVHPSYVRVAVRGLLRCVAIVALLHVHEAVRQLRCVVVCVWVETSSNHGLRLLDYRLLVSVLVAVVIQRENLAGVHPRISLLT